MNTPLNFLADTFYTLPLMMLFNIIFLLVLFTRKARLPYYSLFKFYGFLALMQDVLSILYISRGFLYGTIMMVAFIELAAFYSFFGFYARSEKIKDRIAKTRNIFIICSLLLVPGITLLLPDSYLGLISDYYVVICNLINLVPAFLYVLNFLLQPSGVSLLHQSSFWIYAGILFLNSLEIPLFLTNYYLDSNRIYSFQDYCFTMNFLAYCILFFCFIIGLLCRTNKGKIHNESPLNAMLIHS